MLQHLNSTKKKLTITIGVLMISISCAKDSCESKLTENDCVCTFDYTPVCGCDDVTYSNACVAECQGISDYAMGACH
jgi:hypothetical protein